MLDPYSRRLLLDLLQPPADFKLADAIGTTFSLDLLTLSLVPLALSSFSVGAVDPDQPIDAVALLSALQRYGDCLTLFCQTGNISFPARPSPLLTYLEKAVFEVSAPHRDGVFHPKLWVLRFIGPQSEVRYRLLNLSRNLTFDCSWDTALVLEGAFDARQKARPENAPLVRFMRSLPEIAKPISGAQPFEAMQDRVARLAEELPRVRWDVPSGFSDVAFFGMGLDSRPMNVFADVRIDRLLVISPFLSERRLGTLPGRDNILVSRVDSLAALAQDSLAAFQQTYFLSPAASAEENDDALQGELSGLHAKIYVADAGWDAYVWTGSANATIAGFERNVEFLVRLHGKKSQCGIDSILRQDGTLSFLNLLEPYTVLDEPVVPSTEQKLDDWLSLRRYDLARMDIAGQVLAEQGTYSITLNGLVLPFVPDKLDIMCWPVTLAENRAIPFKERIPIRFDSMALTDLTGFFAIALTAREGTITRTLRFVIKIQLEGVPLQREQAILDSILDTPEKVHDYLLFLLSQEHGYVVAAAVGEDGIYPVTGSAPTVQQRLPLLESMLRTLAQDTEKFSVVARFVAEFGRADLLPEGFDAIWQPLAEAYEVLRIDPTH